MLRIYGHSDDNVELEGIISDEIGCYNESVLLTIGYETGGLVVTMSYDSPGVWSARLRQIAEGVPVPWGVRIVRPEGDSPRGWGYSVAVEIDCPEGTPVMWENIDAPDPERVRELEERLRAAREVEKKYHALCEQIRRAKIGD